jgi:arylsulfatase A-like enzyme
MRWTRTGHTDSALVIWEFVYNGTSMEGMLSGAFTDIAGEEVSRKIPPSCSHTLTTSGTHGLQPLPVGSAWAMNTPFQSGKQIASHFGGTRNPPVISWTARIKDKGGLRFCSG